MKIVLKDQRSYWKFVKRRFKIGKKSNSQNQESKKKRGISLKGGNKPRNFLLEWFETKNLDNNLVKWVLN